MIVPRQNHFFDKVFPMTSWSKERAATVVGLVTGGVGIAVLWAGGVEFPVVVPPGIVMLGVGATIVSLIRRRWTLGLGAFLGLFVTVGFLISGTGIDNLAGDHGVVVALGQALEVIGVVTALIAGAVGVRVQDTPRFSR
jgi:hypothetical protein